MITTSRTPDTDDPKKWSPTKDRNLISALTPTAHWVFGFWYNDVVFVPFHRSHCWYIDLRHASRRSRSRSFAVFICFRRASINLTELLDRRSDGRFIVITRCQNGNFLRGLGFEESARGTINSAVAELAQAELRHHCEEAKLSQGCRPWLLSTRCPSRNWRN